MRGSSTCALSFDNIHLPADALLGPEGIGFKIAMSVLDGGRISCAAIATALSQHAMQIAKDYANERTTFGKPIARHQGVQFKFGDMSALIEAMQLMTYEAAFQKAHGQRCTLIAAQAKLFAAINCTSILPRVPSGPRRQRLPVRTSTSNASCAMQSSLRSERVRTRSCAWSSAGTVLAQK